MWKLPAHLADDFDIPARLNLDLDALVARIEFGLNFIDELGGRILNANRYTARNLGAGGSSDMPGERKAGAAGLKIPDGSFHSAPRHKMATDVRGTIVNLS